MTLSATRQETIDLFLTNLGSNYELRGIGEENYSRLVTVLTEFLRNPRPTRDDERHFKVRLGSLISEDPDTVDSIYDDARDVRRGLWENIPSPRALPVREASPVIPLRRVAVPATATVAELTTVAQVGEKFRRGELTTRSQVHMALLASTDLKDFLDQEHDFDQVIDRVMATSALPALPNEAWHPRRRTAFEPVIGGETQQRPPNGGLDDDPLAADPEIAAQIRMAQSYPDQAWPQVAVLIHRKMGWSQADALGATRKLRARYEQIWKPAPTASTPLPADEDDWRPDPDQLEVDQSSRPSRPDRAPKDRGSTASIRVITGLFFIAGALITALAIYLKYYEFNPAVMVKQADGSTKTVDYPWITTILLPSLGAALVTGVISNRILRFFNRKERNQVLS